MAREAGVETLLGIVSAVTLAAEGAVRMRGAEDGGLGQVVASMQNATWCKP